MSDKNKDKTSSMGNAAIAGGLFEINSRFGDAGAEFLKGLRGVDNQTMQVFNRNLERTLKRQFKLDDLNQVLKTSATSAESLKILPKDITSIMKKGTVTIGDSGKLEEALQHLKKLQTTPSENQQVINQITRHLEQRLNIFNKSLDGKLKQLQSSAVLADKFGFLPKDSIELLKKGSITPKDLDKLRDIQRLLKNSSTSKISISPEAQNALKQIKKDVNNVSTLVKSDRGFTGEVAYVSKKNAEAIIAKDSRRFSRSEDLDNFGKNDSVVDIVETVNGKQVIHSQMKIVEDYKTLINNIAGGKQGKQDYSRYLSNDELLLPDELVDKAKQYCHTQTKELLRKAKEAEKNGNVQAANEYRQNAAKYGKVEKQIKSAGMDTKEVTEHYLNPRLATAKNMANVAHRAGIEGAKFGAAIGGSISLITNLIAVQSGNKEFSEAMLDSATGTLKAAGVGYTTAFVGSTAKSLMQQSTSKVLQAASKTGLPGAIVSVCISTTKSIHSYARGDIDETRLMQEMGGIAVGAVATSLFTVIGQSLIPIPVLGGVIGSMVGGIIVNAFYEESLQALNDAKLAKENRILVEMRCEVARELSRRYRVAFEELFSTKLAQLQEERVILQELFSHKDISGDEFCAGMNRFAAVFGKTLTINSMAELDDAMHSDKPIVI